MSARHLGSQRSHSVLTTFLALPRLFSTRFNSLFEHLEYFEHFLEYIDCFSYMGTGNDFGGIKVALRGIGNYINA